MVFNLGLGLRLGLRLRLGIVLVSGDEVKDA